MRVVYTQYSDGIVTDAREIASIHGDPTPHDLLHRKANSHAAHGWDVSWQDPSEFIAVKRYPGQTPAEKRREFRIGD